MQDKNLRLRGGLIVLISVVLSMSFCFFLRPHFVSLDLIKVVNAQALYANQLISKNPRNKNWAHSVKNINFSLRKAITQVAGQHTMVLAAPAVIQGIEDITDRVLLALGLSTKVSSIDTFATPHSKFMERK